MMPGITGVDIAIAVTETIPACKMLLFSGQEGKAWLPCCRPSGIADEKRVSQY
jgi:hypothetical protein